MPSKKQEEIKFEMNKDINDAYSTPIYFVNSDYTMNKIITVSSFPGMKRKLAQVFLTGRVDAWTTEFLKGHPGWKRCNREEFLKVMDHR